MEVQEAKKPDDGTLPVVLKIIAVLGILGGIGIGSSLADVNGSMAFIMFLGGLVNAVLLWALAAIVTALRQIEHHTRPRP